MKNHDLVRAVASTLGGSPEQYGVELIDSDLDAISGGAFDCNSFKCGTFSAPKEVPTAE